MKHLYDVSIYLSALSNFQKIRIPKALSKFILKKDDFFVCVYDKKWCLGDIKEVKLEHNDFKVNFYKPIRSNNFIQVIKR